MESCQALGVEKSYRMRQPIIVNDVMRPQISTPKVRADSFLPFLFFSSVLNFLNAYTERLHSSIVL